MEELELTLKKNDFSPHCDLEVRNPLFLHDTPGHDDASSCQIWLPAVYGSKDILVPDRSICLSDCLQLYYTPSRTLRSASDALNLQIPRTRLSTLGSRAFSVSVWPLYT